MRRQPGGCGVRVISCRRGEGREPAFHFPIQRSGGWARRVKAEDRMSPKAGEEQKEPLLEQTGGVPVPGPLCRGPGKWVRGKRFLPPDWLGLVMKQP